MSTSTNVARAERLAAFLRSPDIPASYYNNTVSEDKLLTLSRQYETFYCNFFPDRKPLFLYSNNECRKQKMICSFVRPTSLIFDKLFDLQGCCQFVADYIRYEPLHSPLLYEDEDDDTVEGLPSQVVSPATTLNWQTGNCIEMSLVLTSFLIGAGFNAYVVIGTAAPAVCLCDQSASYWEGSLPVEVNSDDEVEDTTPKGNPYMALILENPVLRAPNDPDPEVELAAVNDRNAVSAHGRNSNAANAEGSAIKPVHSWVLVLPGGRKSVSDPVFVEPSTGKLIPLAAVDTVYTSIETLFNHEEYYVNMRPNALVSSLALNLTDGSQWESLFSLVGAGEEESDSMTNTYSTARRAYTSELTATIAAMAATTAAESGDATKGKRVRIPNFWSNELIISQQQYETRFPEGLKQIRYANAIVRRYAPYSQNDLRVQEILVPDVEYTGLEEVHIFYAHRADKLRRRSVYPSAATPPRPQTESSSILASRPATYAFDAAGEPRKIVEWYDKGRTHDTAVEGLRELIYEPGRQRTMKFYWRARSDGLCCRTELLYDSNKLRKVKELYKGRRDFLWYRSFSYVRPSTVRELSLHNLVVLGPGNVSAMRDYPRLDPARISQKFLRNESVAADTDVAKITFLRPSPEGKGGNPPAGEMWIFFHSSPGSLLRPYHMFAKPGSSVEEYIASSAARKPVEPPVKVVTLPGEAAPSELDLYNERKWLNAVEATCLMEQRARMDECMDILKAIEQDHTSVRSVLSSYDTLRNRPKETEAERARRLAEALRREESRKDYLAPYIAKLEMPPDFDGNYLTIRLSIEQAKQVRDEALHELKERLIQRGHIMQSRMDREKEEFNKRQQLYKKTVDASAVEGDKDTEEFALYCKEATWKMKVLDERLSQHIDHASDKYNQLAQRLADDPRLVALYHPGH
ncbi:hypothetical protein ABB37_09940 [Leptomonas pyrrhocoris]|uniref:Coiled-coil domain-containing protein 135 n=1 Tax=Leptomonas pyrrhocoris TaxID=157538 RepID=A0A0M9FPG1_LEPPY|nr:hypothetical protein ABB37_09940 [Leptomonas pyrrhocoris]XP_015651839.1 hypothetical protein ABB37_09940 [Leptomonas pyrrhocoris]KPA73399.1 hypothetical protein ABB37_09940 [Leptomonas pyrrhocoris]KPA73400.1 hypothetical protein ABB37_09940 [Leptomonas pyrrhocoris]|eukprot:XP_015651838.1 hypothetical protein ABB37_09940 [Leptomonas pyrrhocoris]